MQASKQEMLDSSSTAPWPSAYILRTVDQQMDMLLSLKARFSLIRLIQ